MRKLIFVGAVLILIVLCSCGGCAAWLVGNAFVPMPTPEATLVVGKQYWTQADIRSGRLIEPNVTLDEYPPTFPPEIRVTGYMQDATPVNLLDINRYYCEVEGADLTGKTIVGWLPCYRLIDYEPTPVPR